MRRTTPFLLLLALSLALSIQGCGGKKAGFSELGEVNKLYGDTNRFAVLGAPQTVQLKSLLITVPTGWKYDAEVEKRTIFNVKPVMFACNEHLAQKAPAIYLEYMEGSRNNFPTQAEMKKLSPADKEDIKASFMGPLGPFSSFKVMSVDFVEINGLYGVKTKTIRKSNGYADKVLYSLKIPVGDTLTSFLFAFYDYQDGPALQKVMQDIFDSVRPAKQ